MVVEWFLDEMESDRVGRGNQVSIFRVLKTILREAYARGAKASLLFFGMFVIMLYVATERTRDPAALYVDQVEDYGLHIVGVHRPRLTVAQAAPRHFDDLQSQVLVGDR
ncbi:hypothetical protein [Streptomyces viridosporus]|uniref:hypothetical protein n=1 Tax=Streptomyces viridosporus TaxID=67581 RepID=UPI0021000E0A|nr:hypothetical protein [Streptomyces viridosporus]